MSVITFDQLHWSHLGAAIAHGIQSIYTFGLGNTIYKDKGFFPITNQVGTKEPNNFATIQLINLVGIFPAMSMINHLWAFFDRERYESFVKKGFNPVRWIEYGASAGIMFNVISILSLQTDVKALSSQYIANIAMQYVGYLIEEQVAKNSVQDSLHLEIIGTFIFIAIWAPIMTSFFTAISTADEPVPDTVWVIIIIMTFLMLSFAILSIVYIKKISFQNVELGYIILSFISKTFLTNMTLFGALYAQN